MGENGKYNTYPRDGGNKAFLSLVMSKDFHLFVLQKHSPQAHTYVGELRHTGDDSSVTTVKPLVEVVRKDMKSRREFKSWDDDVDGIDFIVYLVR
jgi:hypothetical protein